MENLRLGVLLHFFQPHWQFSHVLKMVADQCYRPIFRFVRNHPRQFAFTANINYSLIELLKNNGCEDILDDIRFAIGNNLIELMGTAAYHPILPLLPEKDAANQIAYDIQQKKFLGIQQNSKGFFFPEMAFSEKSLPLLRKLDYQWAVIEDVAVLPYEIPFNHIISNQGFSVFLRSSYWSRHIWDSHINFRTFAEKLNYELPNWLRGGSHYIVIAMDAETFGHHVPGLAKSFLFPLIENWGDCKIIPFEYLRNIFPHRELEVKDSSWSTSSDDIFRSDPYPLWKSRYNGAQSILWELAYLALKHSGNPEAIKDCLRIVNSCHWWWISRAHWNPRFMIIGAEKALEVVERFGDQPDKDKAKICFDFLNSLVS